MSFLVQTNFRSVTAAHLSISLTCSKPLWPTVAPTHRSLTGFCLYVPQLSGADSTLGALREAFASIRSHFVVVISFDRPAVMLKFLTAMVWSRFSLPPSIVYRFACRRFGNRPFARTTHGTLDLDNLGILEDDTYAYDNSAQGYGFSTHWFVKSLTKMPWLEGLGYANFVWELIDPVTLRPSGISSLQSCLHSTDMNVAGDLFLEHDNIVPELLRRLGFHTISPPSRPTEDDIRANLHCPQYFNRTEALGPERIIQRYY